MSEFRKALSRLRGDVPPSSFSFSEQLRFLADPPPPPRERRERPAFGSTIPDGEVVENDHGVHYFIQNEYPANHLHGNVRLDRLTRDELPELLRLARSDHPGIDPERVVFLDTETTGVHGGAGMCPFLIGLGFLASGSFRIVQYFMRDFDEESSMLAALARQLDEFDLIVTYNGRSFDLPLVENRYVLCRQKSPFKRMTHLDLLFTARRLWRARHGSCKLTALEARIVQFMRGPDIHGSLIPQAYFDYLQLGQATALRSVFSHHMYDILTLAALTIHAADRLVTEPAPPDDALDVYSLGRIFDAARDRDKGIRCYELALETGMPWDAGVRAMERLAVLYRRMGEHQRSFGLCTKLMTGPEFSLAGYTGAALYHERQTRDIPAACGVVEEALRRIEGLPRMGRRRDRLEARKARLDKKMDQMGFTATATGP